MRKCELTTIYGSDPLDRWILYSNLIVISVGQWPCWLEFWLQKWWRSPLISDFRPFISDLNHNEPKTPVQYEPSIGQVFGFEPSRIWFQILAALGYKQVQNKSLWRTPYFSISTSVKTNMPRVNWIILGSTKHSIRNSILNSLQNLVRVLTIISVGRGPYCKWYWPIR